MDREVLVSNKVVTVHLEKTSLGSMQHVMRQRQGYTEQIITDDYCLKKGAGCCSDASRTVASP